ncbi:MAG: histidinol-phosphate transaminase [Bdellovibrionales bacterium]|nr:histidinol-phosphate transaminase [Bdellovibrionales bacterium]
MRDRVRQWVRPAIAALDPYSSARDQTGEEVLLDANEFPWSSFGRYPEPQSESLKTCFANLYGVNSDQILMSRGSDEAIDVLIRTFCEPGQSAVVVHPPTFEIYAHLARIQGTRVIEVPLDINFDLDHLQMRKVLFELNPQIIFLCSPNNPTGSCLSLNRMEELISAAREKCLVVVDEAYVEFSQQESWVKRLSEFPNLVVLRTLSKYWGAAGLRCGVAIADPLIIAELKKVLAPYPIAQPLVDLIKAHLKNSPPSLENLIVNRERIIQCLSSMSCVTKVWPSDANFILVRFLDASWAYKELLKLGMRVRNRSHLWPNSLRISLGFEKETKNLMESLAQLETNWASREQKRREGSEAKR